MRVLSSIPWPTRIQYLVLMMALIVLATISALASNKGLSVSLANKSQKKMGVPILMPLAYKGLDDLRDSQMKQLHMCVVSCKVESQIILEISKSVEKQRNSYSNMEFVYSGQSSVEGVNGKYAGLFEIGDQKDIISQELEEMLWIVDQCQNKSVIVLARSPLREDALLGLNLAYQRYNIWMTDYFVSQKNPQMRGKQEFASVSSFLKPVLENVKNVDFRYAHDVDPRTFADAQNNPKAEQKKVQIKIPPNRPISPLELIICLHKLAIYHSFSIHPLHIFSSLPQATFMDYVAYQASGRVGPLFIQQSMMVLSNQFVIQQILYKRNTRYINSTDHKHSKLSAKQLFDAIEYIGIKELHPNHSLVWREQRYFQKKYHLSSIQDHQLPVLCIIVPSINNQGKMRYKKVMDSISQQTYPRQKVHVVFIDDHSSDETLQLTKEYVLREHQDMNISYIENSERKYATFNIYNSISKYCNSKDSDEIVAIVDGDDQLIGTSAFKLIATLYATTNKWLIYFNYVTSTMMEGVSKPPPPSDSPFFTDQKRVKGHFVSALRTFKAKLYMKIKIDDHKDDNGDYFDAMYDDAMQYPLVEMAGPQRIMYSPQVLYFYNRFYGQNDDSNIGKIEHRQQLYNQVLNRKKYGQLSTLDNGA